MNTQNDTNAPFLGAQDWQQRYDENSTRWERGVLNPAFVHWQETGDFEGIKSVIIPGCGRSPEPLAFAHPGAQVTALDFAPTAVTVQKDFFQQAGIKARIEEADVLTWRPEAPVEAVMTRPVCAPSPRQSGRIMPIRSTTG